MGNRVSNPLVFTSCGIPPVALVRWCENYLQLVHDQQDWDPDTIFGKAAVAVCEKTGG